MRAPSPAANKPVAIACTLAAVACILLIGLCDSLGTWLASRQIVPGSRSERLP